MQNTIAAIDYTLVKTDSTLLLNNGGTTLAIKKSESMFPKETWPIQQTNFFVEHPHSLINGQFMLFVGFFIIFLLALLRTAYPYKIKKTIKAGFNTTFANHLFRDKASQRSRGIFLLNAISISSISMFLFYILPDSFFPNHPFYRFSVLIIGFTLYCYTKSLLYHFVGILSDKKEMTAEYLFNVQIYSRILGLALLPVVIILSFPHIEYADSVGLAGIFLITTSIIALIMRTSKILMGSGVSVFYLILYLCTLEILPILYIFKFLGSLA
ncbi:MAG: DUF4271 domain-containing protein [Mangrovibacterium sp.]